MLQLLLPRHISVCGFLGDDLGNVCELKNQSFQSLHQPQPRIPQLRIVGHDEHIVEKRRDRWPQLGGLGKGLSKALTVLHRVVNRGRVLIDRLQQRGFSRFGEQRSVG